jgi:hypothetical protein
VGFLDKLFGRGGADPEIPGVTTTVTKHPQTGATEVSITATGDDFEKLSNAVTDAVMSAYNKHSRRREFAGDMKIVILRSTPAAVRAELPRLREKLLGVSLGSVLQGEKSLRFQVSEEGGPVEIVDGRSVLGRK